MILIEKDTGLADQDILLKFNAIRGRYGVEAVEIAPITNDDFGAHCPTLKNLMFWVAQENDIEPVTRIEIYSLSNTDPWRSIPRNDTGRVDIDIASETRKRVRRPKPKCVQLAEKCRDIRERVASWKSAHRRIY